VTLELCGSVFSPPPSAAPDKRAQYGNQRPAAIDVAMKFVALLFVVPFVVGQQDPAFVPSNNQPQGSAPASSPQVGGQISIQPGSGALPPVDPNNPHADQQPPNSQGQIPSTFSTQGGQPNQQQPAQQPFDPNSPQSNQQQPNTPGGAGINIQPNSEHQSGGEIVQPAGSQPNSGSQGGSSTQELFGNQATNQGSSTIAPPSQEPLGQDHQNQATGGITGQPANSAVHAIVSGLVLFFAAFIGLL